MTIEELRQRPHLSASSISTYVDCSLSWKFGKVDKLVPEFKPDSMEFGSAIHKAVAHYHESRKQNDIISIEALQELFSSYWSEAAKDTEGIKWSKGKTYDSYLNEGKLLLAEYYLQFDHAGLHVIAVEDPFSFILPDIPWPIVGVVDLIEEDDSGTVIISDLKTAARAYSSADIDNSDQLTIYSMAHKAGDYSERELLLRFDVMLKTKTPKFEQYYTIRTDDDMAIMQSKIRGVWDGISKEVFIPNTGHWKCNGCAYKTRCSEYLIEEAA